MSYLDIILGGLILFGAVKGLIKGLIVEIASLLALILGTYGAIHFSHFVSSTLSNYVEWEENYLNLVAFALTFACIIFVVSLLGKFLTKIAKVVALGTLNNLMGAVFGGLKIALIIGVLLLFFDKANNNFHLVGEDVINESILYQPVQELGEWVFGKVLEEQEELNTLF